MRPGPNEFGRGQPMQAGHPSMHMRHEQGRMFHAAEEGRQARKTIEKDLKPGPVPGMRPTGPGFGPGIPQPRSQQGSGTMGFLMPLYTTGIVIFFVYTVMRIMTRKNDEPSADNQDERSNPRRLHQQLRNQTIPHEYLQRQHLQTQPTLQPAMKPQVTPRVTLPPEEEVVKPPVVKDPIVAAEQPKVKPTETAKTEGKEAPSADPRDEEIMILKQRLEETEKAMQMVVSHMASLTSQMQIPKVGNEEMKEGSNEKNVVPKDKELEGRNCNAELSQASSPDQDGEEEDNEDQEEDSDSSCNSSETNNVEEIESLSSSVPIAQES